MIRSPYSAASSSKIGPIALHGPHQGAQKSTKVAFSSFKTTVLKLSLLAEQATYKKFKPGEMVIGESDPIRSFYVVISGQLKLYRSSAEGKEQTLQLLGPGDPFGLCTAFATDSFPASAMAIEESAVLLIPGTVMEAIARQEPALLFNIIQILSQRLKKNGQ